MSTVPNHTLRQLRAGKLAIGLGVNQARTVGIFAANLAQSSAGRYLCDIMPPAFRSAAPSDLEPLLALIEHFYEEEQIPFDRETSRHAVEQRLVRHEPIHVAHQVVQ